MHKIVVIDFETTGLSPNLGDRATEVAAVIIEGNQVIGKFQSLMNAGVTIPSYIQQLTGISNAMLRKAPSCQHVMQDLADFIGDIPLAAHNASFDAKFLDAEWARIRYKRRQPFACSMLLARRVYPHFPDHKLGTLVRDLKLPIAGEYHRALADAEMAASLLIKINADLKERYQLSSVPHEMLCLLQKTPKAGIAKAIRKAQITFGL
ncbi:MAG: 3'-5' exonuclease [Planctomycetes bacterium]|nr:3'-5' exonuclease [Planctomycetota bacterium]